MTLRNRDVKKLQLETLVGTVQSLAGVIADKAQKKSGLPDTTEDNRRAQSLFTDLTRKMEDEHRKDMEELRKVQNY